MAQMRLASSSKRDRKAKFYGVGVRELGVRLAWEWNRLQRLNPVQNSLNFNLFVCGGG